MQNITFTIITTIYNHLDRLERLFDSLINQTYKNFVHYIYDDASYENPDSLIKDYSNKVKQLSCSYQIVYEKGNKNLGVDLAHRHCFSKVTSPYFIWVDVGDYVSKDFIEISTKTILKKGFVDILHYNGFHIDEKGLIDVTTVSRQINKKYLFCRDQFPCYCYGNFIYNLFAINTSFFRKTNPQNFFLDGKEYGGFFYDNQLMFQLLLNGAKTNYIDRPLFYKLYEKSSVSCVIKQDEEKINEGKTILFDVIESINDKKNFYFCYTDCIKKYRKMKNNFFKGHYKENIKIYREIKHFFKYEKLPSYFWQERFRCWFIYFSSLTHSTRFLGRLLLKKNYE